MRFLFLLWCFPSFLLAADGAVYVSPSGSDANPGSQSAPVATLGRAVELSRSQQLHHILLTGSADAPYFDVSLTLDARDSGLVIEAAPEAHPHLFGGVALREWQKEGDHLFWAALPSGRPLDPRLLLVNGQMRPRSRWPEKGTLTHGSNFNVPWMSTTGGGWKRKPTHQELSTLIYNPADIPESLDPTGAEITVYHMWDESTVGVAGIDRSTHTLQLSPETGHPPGAFGVHKYVLWNVRAGLTHPGQWYFDRKAGRIYYYPLEGEDPNRLTIVIPTTQSILTLKGTKAGPIHNVTLRNLSFSCANVPLISAGFAARAFPAAVSIEHARDCRVEQVAVSGVAGHGIASLSAESAGVKIERCQIGPCGAGGVYIGGRQTTVAHNRIHDVGQQYPSALGILAGGSDHVISHNTIHDTTYSAIDAGGQSIRIEANDISRCMQALHDGAAIYIFGGKSCVMRGNYAHEIADTGGYGASAYYLDEQCQDCTVEGNLAVNVGWPSHNHMARHNTIQNNVFVAPGDMKITFPRSSDYTFRNNVLYAGGKIRIENFDAIASLSNNILYSAAGKVQGVRLRDYSAAGPSTRPFGDTRFGDPMFRDAAHGDFAYKPGSPARQMGLAPLDVTDAGAGQGR